MQKKADCIVTIGGGSLTDGAKAMLLLLANDITTLEQLREFQAKAADTQKKLLSSGANAQSITSKDIPCVSPNIPLICIPTTLSGGEYSHFAGGTDPETGHKSILGHPFCGPRLIINDAKLTTTSPEWVWLSTGVRGIDHCVEAFCRLQPEDTEMDREALEAFKCLVPGLLRTKKDWNDEQSRLDCMLGVNRVMIMLKKGITPGASHAIMFGVNLRGKALTAIILACAGLDFLEFGYDQGLLGGILSGDRFREMLGEPGPTMEGLLSGIYTVGCAGGALVSFIWGEKLGRVGSILWANVIVIIGAVIQTACYSYWQMFVARIIAGIGVGLSTVSVPILQSETLPARNPGAMLVIQSALINAGVAIASWLTFATLFSNSSLQWRFPIAMQVFFSAIVLVLCFFIPETPRWLVSQGRNDEARAVIARLADTTEDDTLVEGQLQEIFDNVKEENLNETSWSDTFHNKTPMRNLHRVVLGMGPYMMNQWSGINSITYYLTYTLQNYLGFERNLALILASVSFTQYAILSWPPYFYIDKIACLLEPTDARSAAAVAFMFLFTDAFTLGILPVSWSYSSEIQPLSTRNKATSVGVASHWLSNFVVVLVTPIGLDNIGTNYYWIWAGVNALFVPLVFFFGVETAGRSLEMVDQDFIEEPRVLMGLNPRHRKVLRATKEDEEQRFRRSSLTGAEKVDEGTERVEAVH
ncbi:general substrate transporter [Hortaea werneckii]|nr:general substrate transporter [Hortaea werneckii]